MIDEQAFVREVEANAAMLYRISMSIVKRDADAQDAVQQALERAWAHRDTARPDRVRAWITQITVNESRNVLRRRKRVEPMEFLPERPPLNGPDLSLRDALDRLPDHIRTPLLLHYMEGFSEKEIAAALSVPQSTVKWRMHQGRRMLRAELSESEVNRG